MNRILYKNFQTYPVQNIKKTIKPYTSVLRRYPELLFTLTFITSWMQCNTAKNKNATFFLKNLLFVIVRAFRYQQTTLLNICGQVNNCFLQNLSKSYTLFRGISYICGRVWGNWGVVFYKIMAIIALAIMDYLNHIVYPIGRRPFYADLKLVPINSNSFSQFYCKEKEC